MAQSFDSTPSSVQTPTLDSPLAANQATVAMMQFNRRMRSSANNFYWIAGLSFINSLITAFGANFYLVMGLASTLFVDYFAAGMAQEVPEMAVIFKMIAIVASLLVSGIFALFGLLAGRGKRWAYILGMVLYGIDTFLMLAFQEWKGLLVHLFFLWVLFNGLRALNQWHKLTQQGPRPTSDFPQNIGTP